MTGAVLEDEQRPIDMRKAGPLSNDTVPISSPSKYAHAALDKMEALGIPPKPNNFAVWYRYFSGAYPDLTRTLDVIIEAGLPFTEERNAEIYDRFLGITLDEDFLNTAAARVETELRKLVQYVEEAGTDAKDYGNTLSAVTGRLSEADKRESLQSVLAHVLEATRTMESRNALLEGRLKSSADEIQRLKDDVENLRHEAMTDALTGVANRKLFDEEIRMSLAESMDRKTPLTLLMIDIDHFKAFNDTHGHQVGDQVLRFVARILKSCVRGEDLTARYGGEEFAIVLRGTDLAGGVKAGDNIRNAVSKKSVVNRATGKSLGTITVSIGAAQFEAGESVEDLIERADEALYQAKHNGRNRVECAASRAPRAQTAQN